MQAFVDEEAVRDAVETILERRDANAAVAKGVRGLWLARSRQGGRDGCYHIPWEVLNVVWRFLGRRSCGSVEVHYKSKEGFFKKPGYFVSLPFVPIGGEGRIGVICGTEEELGYVDTVGMCEGIHLSDCLKTIEDNTGTKGKKWAKSFKHLVCGKLVIRQLPLTVFRKARRVPVVYQDGKLRDTVERLSRRVRIMPSGCGSVVVGSLSGGLLTDEQILSNVIFVVAEVMKNVGVEWVGVKTSFGKVEYIYRDLRGVVLDPPYGRGLGWQRKRRREEKSEGVRILTEEFVKAVGQGDTARVRSLLNIAHLTEQFLNTPVPPPIVASARRGDIPTTRLLLSSPHLNPRHATAALIEALPSPTPTLALLIASTPRVPVLRALPSCLAHPDHGHLLFKATLGSRKLTNTHWGFIASKIPQPDTETIHLLCTVGMPPSLLPPTPTARLYVDTSLFAVMMATVSLYRYWMPSKVAEVVWGYAGVRAPVGGWVTESVRKAIFEVEGSSEEYCDSMAELAEEYELDDMQFHLDLARDSRWGERHLMRRLGKGVRPRVYTVQYQNHHEREMHFPEKIPFDGNRTLTDGVSYLAALTK